MSILTDRPGHGYRRTAQVVSARLADDLAVPPALRPDAGYGPDSPRWDGQSLSTGAAGIAVLHGVRARDGAGDWGRVSRWLTRALAEEVSAATGAGLWHGAPAVAFALLTAAPPGSGRKRLLRRLDASITTMVKARLLEADARIAAARRPAPGEFDLVRGLTGLGAYLLRRSPEDELLREILGYLVRLTEPVPAADDAGTDAPGWWTGHLPAGRPADRFSAGHSDQGMAHGITGPLSLLALTTRAGITVGGQQAAIETICAWLDAWRQDGPAGPWWPERVTLSELRARRSANERPARPSFCYGTPGIARAIQLAGLALGHPARLQDAEDALLRCVTDPVQLGRLDNVSLCHGWAGLLTVTRLAATDASAPELGERLPALLESALRHLPACPGAPEESGNETPRPRQPPGLIEGTAGLALALHGIASEDHSGWETSLLID